MVYKYVLGNPPLGGLSLILVSLEMSMLNHTPPIIKLGGEGDPIGIGICTI